jgi:hypothetical protein
MICRRVSLGIFDFSGRGCRERTHDSENLIACLWAFELLMPSLDVDILHGMEGSYSCYSRASTIIFLRVDIFLLDLLT